MRGINIVLIMLFLLTPGLIYGEDNYEKLKREANRLFQDGMKAHEYELYREALIFYKKSLEINRKIDSKEGIAVNLHNIGLIYYTMKEYEEAIGYFTQSLKIYRHLHDPQAVARTRNNMGNVYSAIKQYDKALKAYNESLKIREPLNIHHDIALVLNNIGQVYSILKDDQAAKYYQRAFEITLRHKIPSVIKACLTNILFLYHSDDDWAVKFPQDALTIFKEYQENHDVILVLVAQLIKMGSLTSSFRIYKNAIKYYDIVLTQVKDTEKSSTSLFLYYRQAKLIAYTNMAGIYVHVGRFQDAITSLENAQKHLGLDSITMAGLEVNVCGVYAAIGEYQKALANCNAARQLFEYNGIIDRALGAAYTSIGTIYGTIGDYEKAMRFQAQALETRKKLLLNTSDLKEERDLYDAIVMNYMNLGGILLAQKQYEPAEKSFQEAEKWDQKFHSAQQVWNSGLVDLYLVTGRPHKALALLNAEETTPSPDALPGSRSILFTTQLGLALSMSGQRWQAASALLNAVERIEALRSRLGQEWRTGFLQSGQRTRPYRALVAVLAEEALGGGAFPSPQFRAYGTTPTEAAFYFAEATKARALVEGVAARAQHAPWPQLPPELRTKEDDLFFALTQLDKTWQDAYTAGAATFKTHRKKYAQVQEEMERFIARLRQDYPRYAAFKYPKPLSVAEVPLTEGEILLEYALTEQACYVFVIENKTVKRVIKTSINGEKLESLVSRMVLPLQNEANEAKFPHDVAQEVYKLLLREALQDVSPGKHLIIVPDGILGTLPFEALVIEAGKDYTDSLYVGDKWQITYAQSATALALTRLLKPSQATKPLFALGNPIYNKSDERARADSQGRPRPGRRAQSQDQTAFRALATRREWGKTLPEEDGQAPNYPPLDETENEIKAIAKLFGVRPEPPDVLLKIFANETRLRQAPLSQYRYLHFATHADLPGKVQGIQEPFLLLGQVENTGNDDGFLTLSEVMQLTLDAEMVTLAACLTGRGQMIEGEGVMNFARAFQQAGARSVLVSLWEVKSAETVEYMTALYSHLQAGKGKAEALRLARRKIKARYPHPFYWAAFILYGER